MYNQALQRPWGACAMGCSALNTHMSVLYKCALQVLQQHPSLCILYSVLLRLIPLLCQRRKHCQRNSTRTDFGHSILYLREWLAGKGLLLVEKATVEISPVRSLSYCKLRLDLMSSLTSWQPYWSFCSGKNASCHETGANLRSLSNFSDRAVCWISNLHSAKKGTYSDSRFDPQWSGFRRVKNVYMQLEWATSSHRERERERESLYLTSEGPPVKVAFLLWNAACAQWSA